MTEPLAFRSLNSSSYLHPLDCCIHTPLRLYSRENTAVIPWKIIALELAAEVAALRDIRHESETASSRFGVVSYSKCFLDASNQHYTP